MAALARNEDDVALARRLDQRLQPDVGEVGDHQHVHHAPGLIGGIADQRPPQRLADDAACAVATDDVASADRLDLALVAGIAPLQPHRHRVARRRIAVDGEVDETARIVRLPPVRRVAHQVEIGVVHPRLIEDDVRIGGQPVLDVLHPAVAADVGGLRLVRLPEGGLVDPIGLAGDALADAEALEHLHRPAGDAVGLTEPDRSGLLLDDRRGDLGEGGQLRRERQARRAAADDEDVERLGHPVGAAHRAVLRVRRGDVRIASLKSVEMKLHGVVSSCRSHRALDRPFCRPAALRSHAGRSVARQRGPVRPRNMISTLIICAMSIYVSGWRVP